MHITNSQASSLILKVIHCGKEDIHKLNQLERKICLKAIESISHPGKEVKIQLPEGLNFNTLLSNITTSLDALPKQKRVWPLRLLISIGKGVLNILCLRYSSRKVEHKILAIQERFLKDNWTSYLKEYCDVIGDVDINKAEVIFLGDTHNDHRQKKVRSTLIARLQHPEGQGKNLVLYEGRPQGFKTKNRGLTEDTWERGSHHTEATKALNEKLQIQKKAGQLLSLIEKGKSAEEERKLAEQAPQLKEKLDRLHSRVMELCRLRDQDLIESVKAKKAKSKRKIFVISGTNHLYREGYDIRSHFPDRPCALIIPKTSALSGKMLPQIKEKMIKKGKFGWNL